MPVSDPIADFLTRIRNAVKAKKKVVDIPFSNMKNKLAQIMLDYKFIKDFGCSEDENKKYIRVVLKYSEGVPAISGMKKISKPGLRIYKGKEELPRVYNGLGISIVSTSKGLMSDKQARKEAVGGEIICHIW